MDVQRLIRLLESRDVETVLSIQAACSEVAQWTLWDYRRVADGEMAGWVAENAEKIVGFLVARQIASDLEILNLAVLPDARCCGIGTALLEHGLNWGRAFKAEKAILEVRVSNYAALRFYERHQFEVITHRPGYYTAPAEDALVLSAYLSPR